MFAHARREEHCGARSLEEKTMTLQVGDILQERSQCIQHTAVSACQHDTPLPSYHRHMPPGGFRDETRRVNETSKKNSKEAAKDPEPLRGK